MKIEKISLILTLLVVFFTQSLKAWEVKSDSTLFVCPWSGVAYSKIMGYAPKTFPLINLSLGLDVEYKINTEISFKSGILLLNKGNYMFNDYKDVQNNPIGEYKTYNHFQYISLPIAFAYNLGRKKFNIWLEAGFNFSFLLKERTYANLPFEVNGVSVDEVNFINTNTFKKLNLGVLAGLGMEYKIKPNFIVFTQIKFERGLNKILKANSSLILKHSGYYAGLGLKFGIPIKYNVY